MTQQSSDMVERCEDCPPIGYPTDKTRCLPCDRLTRPSDMVERLSDEADLCRNEGAKMGGGQ